MLSSSSLSLYSVAILVVIVVVVVAIRKWPNNKLFFFLSFFSGNCRLLPQLYRIFPAGNEYSRRWKTSHHQSQSNFQENSCWCFKVSTLEVLRVKKMIFLIKLDIFRNHQIYLSTSEMSSHLTEPIKSMTWIKDFGIIWALKVKNCHQLCWIPLDAYTSSCSIPETKPEGLEGAWNLKNTGRCPIVPSS